MQRAGLLWPSQASFDRARLLTKDGGCHLPGAPSGPRGKPGPGNTPLSPPLAPEPSKPTGVINSQWVPLLPLTTEAEGQWGSAAVQAECTACHSRQTWDRLLRGKENKLVLGRIGLQGGGREGGRSSTQASVKVGANVGQLKLPADSRPLEKARETRITAIALRLSA